MSERERERGNEKASEGYTVSDGHQVTHTVPVPNPEATAAPTGEAHGEEHSSHLYGEERSSHLYGEERSSHLYGEERSSQLYGFMELWSPVAKTRWTTRTQLSY